jgi:phosphoribosylglycinamide formyltransferase-1
MTKARLALFASGGGSNAEAIIHYSYRENASYRVALLVSNNSQCLALQRAQMFSIPTLHISTITHPQPQEYNAALADALKAHTIDFIALAGYMKHLPWEVIAEFSQGQTGKIFNIHPSLLPKFGGQGMYGLNVHRAVLDAGERESGLTIHEVTAEYDTGAIVQQERVDVLPDDTPETLAARINECEVRIYPEVLHKAALRLHAFGSLA